MSAPTPSTLAAAKTDAAAEVSKVNPGSPIVKPMWAQGNLWVSLIGICTIVSSQVPGIAALLPEGKASRYLLAAGAVAACVGSILSQLAGVTAAVDVHATMDRRKTPRETPNG